MKEKHGKRRAILMQQSTVTAASKKTIKSQREFKADEKKSQKGNEGTRKNKPEHQKLTTESSRQKV